MFDDGESLRSADAAGGREGSVRAALGAYPDEPGQLSDPGVQAGFAELQRLSQAVEAKRLGWLAELERRGCHRNDGYLSAAAWLADRFGLGAGSAKRQVRVATVLNEEPEVGLALARGDVSSDAVGVLVGARTAHPEAFARSAQELLEHAMARPADELRRVVAEWSRAHDAEGVLQRAEALRERRSVSICPAATRMVRVDGELDPESGEVLLTAVGAIVDASLRAHNGTDLRTAAQRRADALTELASRYLDSPDRPSVSGERPHVTVTVDVEALRGHGGASELDHTGSVHSELARRLGCDASLMRLVMAGPSEPLDVGRRTQVISAPLRRAVVARDRRCRFPGCARPHVWCDAHHVIHWADGGSTALANLVLLCRPHHRMVHEGGFRVQTADGSPVFRRPDGSLLVEGRAPPPP